MDPGKHVSDLIGGVKEKLVLGEEEEEGLEIGDDVLEGVLVELKWSMIVRFVTEKNVKFQVMQAVMADLWRPMKGVCVKELGPNLFTFQFFHEQVLKTVVEGGPWTFQNAMLVWKKYDGMENPSRVQIHEACFWVQLYDVLGGMRSKRMCEMVGNHLGKFEVVDEKSLVEREGGVLEEKVGRTSFELEWSLTSGDL